MNSRHVTFRNHDGLRLRVAACRGRRSAFSLAELMIALMILGLGLLFIAAALPVGLDYTRQTVDMATAEAAGDYAAEQIELNLRTSTRLRNQQLLAHSPPIVRRQDNIHRPRGPLTPPAGQLPFGLDVTYEPYIKVHPLVTGNVRMGPIPVGATREIVDDVETTILSYLNATGGFPIPGSASAATKEVDFPMAFASTLSLAENEVLPGVTRAYPPISSVTPFMVGDFFNDQDTYPTYQERWSRLGAANPLLERERGKAAARTMAWTAFYRRISYAGSSVNGTWHDGDDVAESPLLYELIIIVTRRTTANHKFPRQDVSGGNVAAFEAPIAYDPASAPGDDPSVGTDRVAPMPWLVVFDSTPATGTALPLLSGTQFDFVMAPAGYPSERVLRVGFVDPPTLTFRCTAQVGALLPVGSVFIPAVNDQYISQTQRGRPELVGFVPSAPESLPIYEVVDRPDDNTVVVKNNGMYPWLASGDPNDTLAFPVWVIPPCFAERDRNGQPVYERNTPILRVIRRTINIREISS